MPHSVLQLIARHERALSPDHRESTEAGAGR